MVLRLTAILCIIYIYKYIYNVDKLTLEISQIYLEDKHTCDAGYGHP